LAPIEETAQVLLDLQKEGKILALGVSNYSPEQMDIFRKVASLHSTQPPYNIFERDIEKDVSHTLSSMESSSFSTAQFAADFLPAK
jgi:aryl-alcohol dehydrogenase-like predicted oxidoreductase